MKIAFLLILVSVVLSGCTTNQVMKAQVKSATQPQVIHANVQNPALPEKKLTASKSASKSVKSLVSKSARKYGVPVSLALAVSFTESTNRCNIRGAAGELGPLQIKPATAKGLGYKGSTKQLSKNCVDQVEFGMRHLAAAYKRGGSCWKAAYLHNAGIYAKSYKIRGARNYANKVNKRARCA